MSAAGREDERKELHDLAAGHDVTEPVDQLDVGDIEEKNGVSQRASRALQPAVVDLYNGLKLICRVQTVKAVH